MGGGSSDMASIRMAAMVRVVLSASILPGGMEAARANLLNEIGDNLDPDRIWPR
jgi:hypothetical protein